MWKECQMEKLVFEQTSKFICYRSLGEMIDMSGSGKKEVAALLVSDPYEDESNSRTHKALDQGDTAIKHNGYDSAAKIASKKVSMIFQVRESFPF